MQQKQFSRKGNQLKKSRLAPKQTEVGINMRGEINNRKQLEKKSKQRILCYQHNEKIFGQTIHDKKTQITKIGNKKGILLLILEKQKGFYGITINSHQEHVNKQQDKMKNFLEIHKTKSDF